MFQRLDGSPVSLPSPPLFAPRFRLADFLAWADDDPQPPGRLDQIAAEILQQNGFGPHQLEILQRVPGIDLAEPIEFRQQFGRIQQEHEPGFVRNVVFEQILHAWRPIRPQQLRSLAALILQANGLPLSRVAIVLGWGHKGSVSRAIQAIRDELQTIVAAN